MSFLDEVCLLLIKTPSPSLSHILANVGEGGGTLRNTHGIGIFLVIFDLYILADSRILFLGPNNTFFTPPQPIHPTHSWKVYHAEKKDTIWKKGDSNISLITSYILN